MTQALSDIIQLIPGYDPYADSAGYHFDAEAAQLALDFFPRFITHMKGEKAGQPYELEPHEQAITANIMGWKNDDGFRRYREVLYFVARKNSKTTWAAGMLVMLTLTDNEPGAENYTVAANVEQANLCFNIAKHMVTNNPRLKRMVETYKRSIVCHDTNSFLQVLASGADTKHGQNPHVIIIDEFHIVDRDLVNVLVTGQGSRRQPLTIYTTTTDYERESLCNETHNKACRIRDGLEPDPRFLPVIYEAPKDADWKDPKVWALANPNLGKSVKLEFLEEQCKKAQSSPAFENVFKQLHLNIRTEQQSRWLSMDKWDDADVADPVAWRAQTLEMVKGWECMAALDMGAVSDLTALVLAFRDDENVILIPYFWVPSEGLHKKDHIHKTKYRQWINQGFISETVGDITDYSFVRRDTNGLADDYYIRDLAIDRMFNAVHLSTELMEDGFNVIAFSQGYAGMAGPTKTFEELVVAGKIKHGNNPVLRWMASNVSVKIDANGNMKPEKSATQLKIDGIVAAIMAIGRLDAQGDGMSVYETESLFL